MNLENLILQNGNNLPTDFIQHIGNEWSEIIQSPDGIETFDATKLRKLPSMSTVLSNLSKYEV